MSDIDFSSWPREQEQSFVVYEQRTNESQKQAFIIGIVAAVAVFLVAVGIYAGVEPDKKDIAKDMNMSNLTKKQKKPDVEPAPAPTPAPTTAPVPAATDKPDDPPADKK